MRSFTTPAVRRGPRTAASASSNPGSTCSRSASVRAGSASGPPSASRPPAAAREPPAPRTNWFTAASSEPTCAARARAVSAARSASRRAARASSAACSASVSASRRRLGLALELGHARPRRLQLLLEPGQLARQPLLAAGVECRQLLLDRRDPVLRALLLAGQLGVGGRLLLEQLDLAQPALAALARGDRLLAHALQPHRDPFARRAGGIQPRLKPLAVARLRGERLLGLLAPPGHLAQQALRLVALGAHGSRPLLRLTQAPAVRPARASRDSA